PVGSEGWCRRDGAKAEFDQSPVEAASAVEALAIAWRVNESKPESKRYLELAQQALEWYHGKNLKGATLYDPETGACSDGISSEGLKSGKGAESTLSYLLAVTSPPFYTQ
ncbi:MAG: glycosyltransferase, partial [archaeon]